MVSYGTRTTNNTEANDTMQASFDSDELDEEEEEEVQSPAKKRKLSKKEQEKLRAKEKAKAKKKKDDSDSSDDEYTALSRRATSNRARGATGVKPPVGSFENCAECEKQFTVVSSILLHLHETNNLMILLYRRATRSLQIQVLVGCVMSARRRRV